MAASFVYTADVFCIYSRRLSYASLGCRFPPPVADRRADKKSWRSCRSAPLARCLLLFRGEQQSGYCFIVNEAYGQWLTVCRPTRASRCDRVSTLRAACCAAKDGLHRNHLRRRSCARPNAPAVASEDHSLARLRQRTARRAPQPDRKSILQHAVRESAIRSDSTLVPRPHETVVAKYPSYRRRYGSVRGPIC